MGDEQPFIPFTSTWSLANGFGAGDLDPARQLPPAFGVHNLGFQSFGDGCGLFDASVLFTEPVNVMGTVTSESPLLVLRLPLSGLVEVTLQGKESLIETPETYGVFLLRQTGTHCNILQKPGVHSKIAAPTISVERLRNMLDGIRTPPMIARFLDGHDDNFVAAPRMSMAMRRLIPPILDSPYDGDLGSLYRQGKLFELVTELLRDLGDQDHPRRPVVSSEKAKVAAVCDMIRHDLAHPPTMEALAHRVGLSQRRLAEVFRVVTGLSVIEWTVKEKLSQAAELLRDGALSVKEISHLLGYSQVSAFTTAFNRQFGRPPASYRRSLISRHFVMTPGNT
jgi:AraC-like DNA-binding protein